MISNNDILELCKNNNKNIDEIIDKLACNVVKLLLDSDLKIATAESLTGGMISQYITSVSGSSKVIELGICSYSNRIKIEKLGVSKNTIDSFTEVSKQTATQMCEGILKLSSADIGVAVTGVAGPNGGTKEAPVGTVYVCVGFNGNYTVENLELYKYFNNIDRDKVRKLTTIFAFEMVCGLFK